VRVELSVTRKGAGFAKNLEDAALVVIPIRGRVLLQANQTMLARSQAMRTHRVHPPAG
jgi:hypothetical protein